MGQGTAQSSNKLKIHIISSYESPGPSPQGLTWDGKNIWVVDDSTNIIYKIDPLVGKTIFSFALKSIKSRGITWDGNFINLFDHQNGKIHRFKNSDESLFSTSDFININAVTMISSLPESNWGLVWDGQNFYSSMLMK